MFSPNPNIEKAGFSVKYWRDPASSFRKIGNSNCLCNNNRITIKE